MFKKHVILVRYNRDAERVMLGKVKPGTEKPRAPRQNMPRNPLQRRIAKCLSTLVGQSCSDLRKD